VTLLPLMMMMLMMVVVMIMMERLMMVLVQRWSLSVDWLSSHTHNATWLSW